MTQPVRYGYCPRCGMESSLTGMYCTACASKPFTFEVGYAQGDTPVYMPAGNYRVVNGELFHIIDSKPPL